MSSLLDVGISILVLWVSIWLFSSLPLFLSVKLMKGKVSFMKIFFTNLAILIISFCSALIFGLSGLSILLIVIPVYMFMFNLNFLKAFFAWLIQYLIAFILIYLVALIFKIQIPNFLK